VSGAYRAPRHTAERAAVAAGIELRAVLVEGVIALDAVAGRQAGHIAHRRSDFGEHLRVVSQQCRVRWV
jgi:hypothetical protein